MNLAISENVRITRPHADRTNDSPSTPQGNQCLLSHFLGSLEAQAKKSPVSLIIPQYQFSKFAVFVRGKKKKKKKKKNILKFENAPEGEDEPT